MIQFTFLRKEQEMMILMIWYVSIVESVNLNVRFLCIHCCVVLKYCIFCRSSVVDFLLIKFKKMVREVTLYYDDYRHQRLLFITNCANICLGMNILYIHTSRSTLVAALFLHTSKQIVQNINSMAECE